MTSLTFYGGVNEGVKTIDSDMLYPIHTEHPDAYGKVTDKLIIVQEGKNMSCRSVVL